MLTPPGKKRHSTVLPEDAMNIDQQQPPQDEVVDITKRHKHVLEQDSKVLSKFLPLSKAITFFTLDILQPKERKFSQKDFERFLKSDNLESTIDQYMQQYHASIDQSLEGDIYSQNEKRARSIVEEISNSIDANPDEIRCIIRDGYYEIREIDGQGMPPEIICSKYLPPKATTKTGSEKQIGRFGIGSFTKLAHLNNENASVIVETRAPGHIGCRIEYRLIDGLLYVNLSADESITQYGTVTKVTSSEIVAKDYAAILKENIGDDLTIPIYINDQVHVADENKHKASICINNICIQRMIQAEDSNTTKVIWKLPHGTTISESRNKIILDNEQTRKEIIKQIDKIRELPDPDWILYANTIAPLVAEIQMTNTSLLAQDNIFDYLAALTHERLASKPCVPDTSFYKSFLKGDVVALHPSLLPHDWLDRVTTLSPHFSVDHTRVYIGDLVNYPSDTPFLFDKENNRVIVAKDYYEKIKSDNNLQLLEIIFKYPPQEIDASLCLANQNSDKESSNVEFCDVCANHCLHTLYQKHGLLWLYGEEATQKILQTHPDAVNILMQAKSLVSIYHAHNYLRSPSSIYTIGGPLLAIRFKGKCYYADMSDNWELVLFDEHFQVLYGNEWEILRAKIRQQFDEHYQNNDAYLLDLDITIEEDDILAINNQLYNGQGKKIAPGLDAKNGLRVKRLNESWYLIIRWKSDFGSDIFVFKPANDTLIQLPNDYNISWKAIPNSSLVAGFKKGEIIHLLDSENKSILCMGAAKILQQGNYLLAIFKSKKEIWDDDQTKFILFTLKGEIIYQFTEKFPREVMYFDYAPGNEGVFYLSMIDRRGTVHCEKIKFVNDELTHEYIGPDKTIGFPVRGFINHDEVNKTNSITLIDRQSNNANHAIENYHFKFLYPYQNQPYDDPYYPRDEYNKISLDALYYPNPIPILLQDQAALLDLKTLAIVPLQTQLDIKEITDFKKGYKNNYYYLNYPNKNYVKGPKRDFLFQPDDKATFTSVFNEAGKHIATGHDVRIYKTERGDCIQVDDQVFLPNGNRVDCGPVSYIKILKSEASLLAVSQKSEEADYAVFDLDGRPYYSDKKISYMDTERDKGFYSIRFKDPDSSWLYTPYGKIENGRLYATNSHVDNKMADDLVVKGYGTYNYLLTRAGYPFFNEAVPEWYEILRHHIALLRPSAEHPYKTILNPLTLADLTDKDVLDKLAYLNQLNLSTFQYSQCLRFIHWPQNYLQNIVPYIEFFTYTPCDFASANDYQTIIQFSEQLSAKDRELVLKTFNLILLATHEKLREPIAQKLINVIEIYGLNALNDVYLTVAEKQHELGLAADYTACKTIIDEMPTITGQICYYLIYPEQQLLASQQTPCFAPLTTEHHVSLLNFMAAYQFDDRILELLGTPEKFIDEANKWGKYADKSHLLRLLEHAIYHQSDPNKHLYERELLQNALDAYASMSIKGQAAHIPVHLYRQGDHCVFRMENGAAGMSLKDVFYYFALIGTSSKRSDRHRHFIGGHGVGAFTVYHNAESVRLKTGKKDGRCYCFEFRPIYQNDKIVDIDIKWEEQADNFDGVIVERADRSNKPTLTAARHHRTFKTHARTVNADTAVVMLNDHPVNHGLTPIASIVVPELGNITLYQSVEDMLTAGGLTVRPINHLDDFIPDDIRNVVRKKGLIIDLPKQIPLNRERNEVIDADHVYGYLAPYLLNAYIEAYVRLFMQDNIALTELPYDFFEFFEVYVKDMETLDPALQQDAENMQQNKPLSNYAKYNSIHHLHQLMAYLPLFKIQKEAINDQTEKKERYTLIELAQYYRQHHEFPKLELIPSCLLYFASKFESSCKSKKFQQDYALTLDNFPEIDWTPMHFNNAPVWQALQEMSQYIAQCMGFDNITFGFSTAKYGDLLHTRRDTHQIYWNVYSLSNSECYLYMMMADFARGSGTTTHYLNLLLESISHELTHAQLEEACSSTHNRTFSIKQRNILVELSKRFSLKELDNELQLIYNRVVGKKRQGYIFDCGEFIKSQFMANSTNLTAFGLFKNQMNTDDTPTSSQTKQLKNGSAGY